MTFLFYEIQQGTLPVKIFCIKANHCKLFAQTYFHTTVKIITRKKKPQIFHKSTFCYII